MIQTEPPKPTTKLWPCSTSVLLVIVGLVLAVASFVVVISMGPLVWHGARDAELSATYTTYQSTGVLLIKPTGSGSYGVQAPATGPLAAATWDDDPGSYIVASLLSHVTHSASPYPGLTLVQALLVALPLLWLPTAVARLFKKARAGFALVLLPPVVWLTNGGALLVGTEYGLSDQVSTLRVYALYGIAASLAFLSLSLLLLLSTFRLRIRALIAATLLFGVLAGFGDLARAMSGMGIAACVGVLWWLNSSKKWRWITALLASVAVIVLAVAVQSGVMGAINTSRAEAIGQTVQELPDAHGLWHSMYMGLSYPQPINGVPSRFGVTWSDEYGWAKAREVDPDVVIASAHYDEILKGLYWEKVSADPLGAVKLYVQKALFVFNHFGAMIAFIIAGFGVAFLRKGRHRKPLGVALVIGLPTLALGLLPPVLVMPMLYYYSELSAALGILSAVALGSLVWWASTLLSRVRTGERNRLLRRFPAESSSARVSVIVRHHDSGVVTAETLCELAGALTAEDEVVVVDDGSAVQELRPGQQLSQEWDHACGLVVLDSRTGVGEALRTGVLTSAGRRVLLSSGDNVVTAVDYQSFIKLPTEVTVAVSSDGVTEPRRNSRHLDARSRLAQFMRRAILHSPTTTVFDPRVVWADGDWIREFARASRESGELWIAELLLAAEQEGIMVSEVFLPGTENHLRDSARPQASGLWHLLVGYIRLALHKDDFSVESGGARP